MDYLYYCTYCGRSISQDTVLFDMAPLLTNDLKTKMNIISVRLKRGELERLYANGTVIAGDPEDYRQCKISLNEMLDWISNGNNLNDERIRKITVDAITKYILPGNTKVASTPIQQTQTWKDKEQDAQDDSVFSSDPLPPPATNQKDKDSQSHRDVIVNQAIPATNQKDEDSQSHRDVIVNQTVPATNQKGEDSQPHRDDNVNEGIKALEDYKAEGLNMNEADSKERVKDDLRLLKNIFIDASTSTEKEFVFDLRLVTEDDNQNQKVLCGYAFRKTKKSGVINAKNARVCPHCGYKVFDYAGTAKHKLITFIGDQEAGKTCTILALTEYLKNAIIGRGGVDGIIWNGFNGIDFLEFAELVSPSEDLKTDMKDCFENGYAADKTGAIKREESYSATFRLRNRVQRDQYHLLTLIDLPGDLFKDDGSIDSRFDDQYAIAKASDLFVLCFDTTKADTSLVTNTCSWANELSKKRSNYKRYEDAKLIGITKSEDTPRFYAPIMVVFTKNEDLENGKTRQPQLNTAHGMDRRIRQTFVFNDERNQIEMNPIYLQVGTIMGHYDRLKEAYIARLRCSPYGFAAPKRKVKSSQNTEGGEAGQNYLGLAEIDAAKSVKIDYTKKEKKPTLESSIKKLELLTRKTEYNSEEKKEVQTLLEQLKKELKEKVPGLNLSFNSDTGCFSIPIEKLATSLPRSSKIDELINQLEIATRKSKYESKEIKSIKDEIAKIKLLRPDLNLEFCENTNTLTMTIGTLGAQLPQPKNIECLMWWLLCATGCIPINSSHPWEKTGSSRARQRLNAGYTPDYCDNAIVFIERDQYRSLPPFGTKKDGDVHEALARCYLFENPGKRDQNYLNFYNQRLNLFFERHSKKPNI